MQRLPSATGLKPTPVAVDIEYDQQRAGH